MLRTCAHANDRIAAGGDAHHEVRMSLEPAAGAANGDAPATEPVVRAAAPRAVAADAQRGVGVPAHGGIDHGIGRVDDAEDLAGTTRVGLDLQIGGVRPSASDLDLDLGTAAGLDRDLARDVVDLHFFAVEGIALGAESDRR